MLSGRLPGLSQKSLQVSKCETHHHEPWGPALQVTSGTTGGLLAGGVGHVEGSRASAFGDCTGFFMECSGEEPKAGQRRALGDLSSNKCGIRE